MEIHLQFKCILIITLLQQGGGQISNWTHAFQFNPKRFRSPRADAIDVSSGIDKEKLTFYIPAFLAHFTALLIFCSISRVAEQDQVQEEEREQWSFERFSSPDFYPTIASKRLQLLHSELVLCTTLHDLLYDNVYWLQQFPPQISIPPLQCIVIAQRRSTVS